MAVYSDEHINFYNRTVRDGSYTMPRFHYHDKHELYYLEKGRNKYLVGNEIYILNAGDMLFIPKGIFHRTDRYETDYNARLLLVFDDSFAGTEYLPFLDKMAKNKFIRIPADKRSQIEQVFHSVSHEVRHHSEHYVEMEKLYLRQLLLLIDRYRVGVINGTPNDSYRLIQDSASYISNHYNAALSLDFLAGRYSLSKSYFSKLFKEVTGVCLSEYINVIRVTAAETLLAKREMSVTAVAEACGFNDSNYFATVFKKIKGISPKQYSKNC